MTDWLRLLSMIFYAPVRGLRGVRDRNLLAPAVVTTYFVQVAYVIITHLLAGDRAILRPATLLSGVQVVLTIAIVLVPVTTLIANLFDRKGSFGVVLQQEYGSLASVMMYAFIGVTLFTLLIVTFFHFSGIQAGYFANTAQSTDSPQMREWYQILKLNEQQIAENKSMLTNPVFVSLVLFESVRIPLLFLGGLLSLREVFRLSVLRSLAVLLFAGLASLPLSLIAYRLFGHIIGSPFLLIFAFFLLRSYFKDIVGTQRARAVFKQNLEAATINPRDSSAHYNLGLIHQQRGELDQAKERFNRAIDIDPEELDAHYQLGRIARAQNNPTEAIGHFEQVVQRDQSHAQHEIWREIGATYLAAEQYSDARDALERFLDRRPNDPQGLYLIGRAYAGLGNSQQAASSMQACIEAVKTAPAYKYRSEKRWLTEAQQFIKNNSREALSSRPQS